MSKEGTFPNGRFKTRNEIFQSISPVGFQKQATLFKKHGSPFFTINDLRTTQYTLAQILRYICIKDNISRDSFRECHRRMALQTYMPTNKITEEFNNTSRAILYPRVTWDLFEKFVMIVGYDITDLTFQLVNRNTGECLSISKSDVAKMVADSPYPDQLRIAEVRRQEQVSVPEEPQQLMQDFQKV